jgi:hypothetical protein
MVNKEIRKALLQATGISKQALSQRAQTIKKNFGPMTTDDAVYIIAHQEGIDISKYLSLIIMDRIRAILPSIRQDAQRPKIINVTHANVPRNRKATMYPLISEKLEAISFSIGSNSYPKIFQLENSIRLLITRLLSKHGKDWWLNEIPNDVQKNVDRTIKKEKRYPQRLKRGNHPIYYANFDDLKKIILDTKLWPIFQPVLLDYNWVKVKMEEVYMARNCVAHCVEVTTEDVTRINLFYNEWSRLLVTAEIK